MGTLWDSSFLTPIWYSATNCYWLPLVRLRHARRVSFELSVSSIEVGDTLLHDLCVQFQDVALKN